MAQWYKDWEVQDHDASTRLASGDGPMLLQIMIKEEEQIMRSSLGLWQSALLEINTVLRIAS